MALQVLPHMAQSTLRLLRGDAPGVSSPMLYIGMLFATFAWHVEDHYLYSINYQHLGAAKTWYGVPASHADAFEEVARKHVYTEAVAAALAEGKSEAEVAAAVHAALLGKTTMFTPKLLTDNGTLSPVFRGCQHLNSAQCSIAVDQWAGRGCLGLHIRQHSCSFMAAQLGCDSLMVNEAIKAG